jgi:hypothetical protein
LQEHKEAAPILSLDPAEYLKDLLGECRHIEIRGLQVGTMKVHKYPIEELYISLTTTLDTETGDKGKAKFFLGRRNGYIFPSGVR